MSFREEEIAYLRSQGMARIATLGRGDQPDVVPVAFEFDGADFWIGGSGETVLATRKVRNIEAGRDKVALVIDDMVSFDPFIARSIRVYGRAEPPIERVGMLRPLCANCPDRVLELEHGRRTRRRHLVRSEANRPLLAVRHPALRRRPPPPTSSPIPKSSAGICSTYR